MTVDVVYTATTRAEYDEVVELLRAAGVSPMPLDDITPRRADLAATSLSWRVRIAVPVAQRDAARVALTAWQERKTRAVRSHLGEIRRIALISLPITVAITVMTYFSSDGDPADTLSAAIFGGLGTFAVVGWLRHWLGGNRRSTAP